MKDIVPWPFPKSLDGFLWRLSSRFIIATVGFIGKFILNVMNSTRVVNRHVLVDVLDSRPCHVPVITVANHTSCFDDPGLWSILPIRHVFNIDVIRWSLTAHNICFTNNMHSQFFARGKCVPVVRGGGVYQRAMDYCIQKLNEGQWVHVFPEGRVNMDNSFIRFKWGVGRLIAESKVMPIVIPFWHCGMDQVLPNEYPYRFQWGKQVLVNFGQPIDLKAVMQHAKDVDADDVLTRKMITDKIQEEMMILKDQTERMYSKLKKTS
ncbi:tafazzin-like isoform X2 [Daphnia carinata]|uniref:tafazzin-like isoform X2 n=1 Tax=Daphnia carinata TaxID=120202 RepID=UPI00257F1857|nr:tafazzin-like isoform X2 [Daphnia carinata]